MKEETVDDALAAVALLRRTPGIDPERIAVLGHSLGGMLVPRIGARDSGIAGFVVMAGATRPLEDHILEQMAYIERTGPAPSAQDSAKLAGLREQVARIKDPGLLPGTPAGELLGVPASYWLDLRGYQPARAARSLRRPILVLQGGRDYQVTTRDFAEWKEALGERPDVRFELYPALNHLLIPGEGPITPAEYARPGHISPEVIEDIATWIRSIPGN